MKKDIISDWSKEIDWEKRVKAVCKPCWEIKYCPYGPLVENFPLKEIRNEKACLIFGHDCPVFYVAEPFTETKELRKITRSIPRTIQFKVLKRENQICSICNQPVRNEDIELDHIIPWSKGGPTEEHNIRLLCSNCNKKRSDKFEKEFLISSVNDHYIKPNDIGLVKSVIFIIDFGHDFFSETGKLPEGKDFAERLNGGELTADESSSAQLYNDLYDFFLQKRPKELKPAEFKFLKLRWGFFDYTIRYLNETCQELNFPLDQGIKLDRYIIEKLGFKIKDDKITIKKWGKL
jgi:hypothetical protein